ncbi:hypothetical protein D9758_006229 [Tetrapyrgos nigripes]|uniref:Phytocyanin domain-containing protein n=1 Tax=Tetrapyrgos nigripes TaxID=182062 RepID=A0A8H5GAT9_9AGAR|nr:hypothetical protein D9758_006229 [Tetrapyrgos nigripes]
MGKKGIGFDPSVIHPVAGDHIVFEFRSGQHSVVESSYDTPCTPANGGFNSEVQTVPDSTPVDADDLPTVTLAVTDSSPRWFFDQAGGKCQQGGVLAVNPSGTQTPAGFKENAAKDSTPSTPTSTSGPNSTSGGASQSSSGSNNSSSTTETSPNPTTSNTSSASVPEANMGLVPFLMTGVAAALLSMVLS